MTDTPTREKFVKPAYWSDAPAPAPAPPTPPQADDRQPTRFGDWEKNGIAVDF